MKGRHPPDPLDHLLSLSGGLSEPGPGGEDWGWGERGLQQHFLDVTSAEPESQQGVGMASTRIVEFCK